MPHTSTTVRRTFLFTDIESSTRLWDQYPDAMLTALDLHDDLLRTAVGRAGGTVYRHTGDGMVAVFPHPAAAIEAAVDAQRAICTASWAGIDEFKVRMGVHSGDVVERGVELHGWALNVASRVHALAHGGQVVVSGPALPEPGHPVAEPVRFVDLGMHRLRDVAKPMRVYTVVAEGLSEQFDRLRESARPLPSIPRPLTSFIGRADEVAKLAEHLRSERLVTITGAAGVGKTRVAIEVARQMSDEFTNGVAMCELSGVTAAQVGAAIGTSLGVERRTLRSPEESVVEWLHDRDLLLVLDNCEDVDDAAADLARSVSLQAPRCRLLVTSREPLDAEGERVVRLQPLGVDDGTDDHVVLFLDRARSAGAQLTDDARTRALVREVCDTVAGVPLAIEIAASNAASLSMLDLLDAVKAGDLPAGGRQGSLHDTMSLTFERLSPDVQSAFLRCSVFAGSFDRVAFGAVAAPGASGAEVLAMVRELVDRSLLVSETRRERTRFRLLEPVRRFAAARLDDATAAALDSAFVQYFVDLAGEAADALRGRDEVRWLVQVELDFDNLRAAHARALHVGQPDPALRIVASLWDFAFMRMRSEIFDWGEAALVVAPRDHPLRPLVLGVVALGGWIRDHPAKSAMFAEEALRMERESGAERTLPVRLAIMNAAEYGGGETDVRAVMAEVVELSNDSASPYWKTNADVVRSLGQSFAGRSAPALDLAHRAMEIARESGNPSTLAWALFARGVATELVDPEYAETLIDDALVTARAVENRWIEAMCTTRLASMRRRRGSVGDAMTMVLELLETWERAGHRSHLWSAVRQAALCLADLGDPANAVMLNTAAASANLVLPQLPADSADLVAAMQRIRDAAADDDYRRWVRRGEVLDQVEAVRVARERLHAAVAA